MRNIRWVKSILLLTLLSFFMSCSNLAKKKSDADSVDDFEEIKNSGELTILTLSGSTSYFMYREEPMGFHYDLAKAFCEAYGLTLKVKLANSTEHLVEMLQQGEGDVIAYPLPILNELKDSINYCGLSLVSHQVLVQKSAREGLVKDVTDLIGKKVTVRKNSKYHQRIENLNAEIGGGIEIDTSIKDSLLVEDLIEMVSKGELEYTLSDEYLAKLNNTYFRNINVDLPVSFEQRASWAVAKKSIHLAKALDEWYSQNKKEPRYRSISKKYFELSKLPFSGEFSSRDFIKGQISPYDELFKKHVVGTRFDWQLLAAISYQESRFKNGLTSWAGASGIMGLMPSTAKAYGLTSEDRMDPDLSIEMAMNLILRLDKILSDIEDPHERTKFVLAAYNGGIGHIIDIRALTEKYGDNKYVWEGHVSNWMTKKRDPQYYNDPVCKSGYFRGTETLEYVNRVIKIAEMFKNKSKS